MPGHVTCSDETIAQLKVYAQQLLTFINEYKWLTDSYVVEFFVKNKWNSFPKSWQAVLNDLSAPEVAHVLLDSKAPQSFPEVWPLSLLSYRAATSALALDHIPVETQGCDIQNDPTYQPVDLLCRLHVKEKKRHEISRVAEVINSTCKHIGCKRVVDVGSGHGHLSRLLSFGYGLQVTSIEAVGCHITGASKVDTKIKTIIEKRVAKQVDQRVEDLLHSPPQHVECTVHPQITVEEFLNVINNQSYSEDGNLDKSTTQCVGDSTNALEDKTHGMKCMEEEHVVLRRGWEKVSGVPIDVQTDVTEKLTGDDEINNKKTRHRIIDNEEQIGNRMKERNDGQKCNLVNVKVCEVEHCHSRSFIRDSSFVLAGLHTCGDLAPTILRVFSKCEQARALTSIACCYMKMESALPSQNSIAPKMAYVQSNGAMNDLCSRHTETSSSSQINDNACLTTQDNEHGTPPCDGDCHVTEESDSEWTIRAKGYPMSGSVQSLGGSDLQFESLELACHSLHSYFQRLKDGAPNLILHGYRATLEVMIQGTKPELTQTHDGIRRIKKAIASVKKPHLKSFEEYASAALTKLDIPFIECHLTDLREALQPSWHNVVTFHAIRSLMGPIIESLVLVDRVLYLYEQGIHSKLIPVFDASLSPRNFVLLAVKK